MKYFIKIYSNKPKEDINRFVEGIGYKPIAPDIIKRGGLAHFMIKTLNLFYILWRIKPGDFLLIQYPYKKFYSLSCKLAHLKGAHVITLIHDLGSFRRKKLTAQQENVRLMHTDYLICHNESMKQFLIDHGFTKPIGCLEIFDYVAGIPVQKSPEPHNPWKVTFAGGLSHGKSDFLYQMDNIIQGWELQLYGKGFDETAAKDWTHVFFNGSLTPTELIEKLEGDFGLVWDGDSPDACTGNWGEYLKINNPHKTSFTLRMGLPVIIWKQAAMAPFIEKHGVGLCVDSLRDLNEILANLSIDEYNKMRKRAIEMSKKVAAGHFTLHAVRHAERVLSKKFPNKQIRKIRIKKVKVHTKKTAFGASRFTKF